MLYVGTLPPSIGNLLNLQSLELFQNLLTGTIPEEIGGAQSLQYIDLSLNRLYGLLPASLTRLANVSTVVLANNVLQGSIPNSWGTLSKLMHLDLSINHLTGSLSQELENITSLSVLNIGSNAFEGRFPGWVISLRNLTQLIAPECSFSGPFQDSLTSIASLRVLNLAGNKLTSTIPDSWNYFELVELALSSNLLTGSIPSSLMRQSRLEVLELDNNVFSQSLPSDMSSLKALSTLDLSFNFLSGQLPESLWKASSLSILSLSRNIFTGTIPDNMENMELLYSLLISDNFFTGSIPSTMTNLSSLYIIQMSDNQFTGQISNDFVNAHKLSSMQLAYNYLTGSFPSSYPNWTSNYELDVGSNHMIGALPEEICKPPSIGGIYVENNHFSGPLPSSLGECKRAIEMLFFNNMLTGTIPETLNQATQLSIVFFYLNQLTGTIPKSISTMNTLTELNVAHNLLHGNISSFIVDLNYVFALNFATNLFTGTLDFRSSQYLNIYVLNVASNELSGTIPPDISNVSAMQTLFLNNNMFHGTLPSQMLNLQYLDYLNLSTNFFEGEVAGFINPASELGFIHLGSNFFSGQINTVFRTLHNLFVLVVSNNLFTGPITSMIDPTLQLALVKLDVSANSLSGSLPNDIYQLTNFADFIAAINCFTGSIPNEICYGTNLSSIIFDGLHASPLCNERIFPWGSSAVYPLAHNGISQKSLPTCLLNLPELETLHISGNGIRGTLPSNVTISPFLTDLVLSHNEFSGTIPMVFYQHFFANLDLSFNQLKGSISDDIVVQSSGLTKNATTNLKLQNNRLSGRIPSAIQTLPYLTVLEGNMFQCQLSGNDLPTNDPQRDSYQCGSDFVNFSLIVWTGLYMIIVLVLGVVLRRLYHNASEVDGSRSQWWERLDDVRKSISSQSSDLLKKLIIMSSNNGVDNTSVGDSNVQSKFTAENNLKNMVAEAQQLRLVVYLLSGYLLVVMMAIYAVLTVYFGTYTWQYAWTVSFTFLEGVVPDVVLVIFLSVFVLLIFALVERHRRLSPEYHQSTRAAKNLSFSSASPSANSRLGTDSSWSNVRVYLEIFALTLANCAVSLLVNAGYVLAVANKYSLRSLATISFGISVFKLVWGNLVVIQWIGKFIQTLLPSTWQTVFLLALSVFNNIVAPYAAEGFVSSNCFQYALRAPPIISSSFSTVPCVIHAVSGHYNISIVCGSHIVDDYSLYLPTYSVPLTTVEFHPPFLYSYQCSSSLLVSFAYVFVLRYLLSGLVLPAMFGCIKFLQGWSYERFGGGSRTFRWCTSLLPLLLRPLSVRKLEQQQQQIHRLQPSLVFPTSNLAELSQQFDVDGEGGYSDDTDATTKMWLFVNDQIIHGSQGPLLMSKAYELRIMSDLAVLLTFGCLFPPLALVIAVSMLADMYMVEFSVGRVVNIAKFVINISPGPARPGTMNSQALFDLILRLNVSFAEFGHGLWRTIPLITCFAALFWSFSLYDTLGPSANLSGVWVVLSMVLMPVLLLMGSEYAHRWRANVVDDTIRPAAHLNGGGTEERGMKNESVRNPLSVSQSG